MSTAPTARPNPLNQALRYLAMGLSVIPLRPRDKKPKLASWKEYQGRLSTEEELRAWFADGRANLGIVTGAVSGVVVVDADSQEAQSWIQAQHPSPMTTVTGKGRHFWFRHPITEVRNGAKLRGMALDVRGDGGYVVAPGSVHPDGGLYTEEGVWSVEGLPVFESSWLQDSKVQPLKAAGDDKLRRATAYVASVPGAPEGERDATAFRLACKLVRGFDLADTDALDLLTQWAGSCAPPFPTNDLPAKIRSAHLERAGAEPYGGRLAEQPGGGRNWTPPPAEDVDPESVYDMLAKSAKGAILSTPGNLAKVLRLDPEWAGRLTLNEMSREIHYRGQPCGEHFVDFVQEWMEDHYQLRIKSSEVQSKLLAQASASPFHPVRQYLQGLPAWDGVARFGQVVEHVLHAREDQPLAKQYVTRTCVAAVRRVFEPGVKVDTSMVLVGPQGYRKSTFWAVLGGDWFNDSPIDMTNKDGLMILHRSWIHELGEIDGVTRKQDAERLKAFLSSSTDIFRPPFGRTTGVYQRTCIIVGSTNETNFLMDPSGSRRFWIIKVGDVVDTDILTGIRDQVWAEALHYHRARVEHWLDRGMDNLRAEQAEEHEAEDPWVAGLDLAVGAMVAAGKHPRADGVNASDLLTYMDIKAGQQTRAMSMRLGTLLRKLGWTRRLVGFERRSRWFPPE